MKIGKIWGRRVRNGVRFTSYKIFRQELTISKEL